MNSALKRNILFVFLGTFICCLGYLVGISSTYFSFEKTPASDEEPLEATDALSEFDETIDAESGLKTAMHIQETTMTHKEQENAVALLRARKTTLWIDRKHNDLCVLTAGKDMGVIKGMIFDLYETDSVVGQVEINQVDEVQSMGSIISDKSRIQGNYFTAKLTRGE